MNRCAFPSLALSFLILFASSPAAAAGGALLEKTVDVPREAGVTVDLTYEKVTLVYVESINAPKERDVEDAKKTDPKDKTPVLIRFHYKNDDYVKQKVNLRAVLLDANGGVVADGGRSGSLDPQQKDDTFTFLVFVRTVDWPSAVKMKVIATFK
jgi:hypothetical protein